MHSGGLCGVRNKCNIVVQEMIASQKEYVASSNIHTVPASCSSKTVSREVACKSSAFWGLLCNKIDLEDLRAPRA